MMALRTTRAAAAAITMTISLGFFLCVLDVTAGAGPGVGAEEGPETGPPIGASPPQIGTLKLCANFAVIVLGS